MKERGIQPVRPWMEKPIFISSTAGTFEAYVPPEGDGKVSVASKEVSEMIVKCTAVIIYCVFLSTLSV